MRLGEATFTTLAYELLDQGVGLCCCTIGRSMFPLIRGGNLVDAEPVGIEDLKTGDIVLYKTSRRTMVAHRFLKMTFRRDTRMLVTKGDSFPWWALEYIKAEQILGRVVSITWGNGVRIKVDGGLGRYIGIWLAMVSPLAWGFYHWLKRVNAKLNVCTKSQAF